MYNLTTLLCIVHDAVTGQAVVASTLGTIVDQDLILVLCLKETTHSPLHQAVLLDKLVTVISLLQQNGGMVFFFQFVVFHSTVGIEGLPRPVAAYIDIASLQARRLQEEMHHNVLCRCGIVIIVGTSQYKDTVLVFGITVRMVDRCREKRSMIVWFEPIDAVHSCGCTMHIEYLETMILVACGEDKVAIVRKLYRIGATDVWHKPLHTTVPTAVLHYNNLQFSVRVENRQTTEANRQGHLLMTVVEVDIGIAAQLGNDACLFLVETKAGFEHRLFFHILLVNANTIVATQTQTEFLIRNTKPIMCNYDNGDMYAGQPVLVVAQIRPVKIMINISEPFFGKLKKGMPVFITLDAYGDEVFKGKIARIYPTIDQTTHTFRVEVSIPNNNERVRPGMFARVTLPYGKQNNVVIPDRAVQKLMGSGDRYVFVYNPADSTVRYSKVELGRRLDSEFEVYSGVEDGEIVVTKGHMGLTNGAKVELVK